MNFKLEIKLEADFELIDIFSYYDSLSKTLGDNFIVSLELTKENICKNPFGFEVKHKNFRQVLVGKFPYLVIFEIHNKTIVVYSVIHARKHPAKRFKKGS